METRFFQKPQGSFFLFWPRATGKSTWLRHHLKEAVFVDLLDPETYRRFAARPARLRELVASDPGKKAVVVDGIPRVPELLDAVHQLIEARQGCRFVLTGSSARKLKRARVDLLAGRAALKTMHPFLADELRKGFDMDQALQVGLVPLVVDAPSPRETLGAYAAMYLREEVQMEGRSVTWGSSRASSRSLAFPTARC